MELGTGIFLSSLVLAAVILYGITKDRWRWRSIIRGIAIIFFGPNCAGNASRICCPLSGALSGEGRSTD